MTPPRVEWQRRVNEIPRPRNHWDIGHVGLGIPLGHPAGGYWTRAGASASISTQPTTALAFGCVLTNVCEALSVSQLPCA
jgi:hypothetical protein